MSANTSLILRCESCQKRFRLRVQREKIPRCRHCGGKLVSVGKATGVSPPPGGEPVERVDTADVLISESEDPRVADAAETPALTDSSLEPPAKPDFAKAPTRIAPHVKRRQRGREGAPPARLGHYRVIGKIGEGAMGVVYKARDPKLDRLVALKVLRSEMVANDEIVQRFRQEAEAISKLRHPFIVGIYDFRQDGDQHYFSMDFVEGRTLEKLIDVGELTLQEKLEIFTRFLRALGHAHRKQVIHRDIKPSNIIVDDDNNPHITDFGLAKTLDRPSRLTREGQSLGTPMYMSPEQVQGRADDIDARSDLYSAGVVFFQLLSGKVPYQANNSLELFDAITSHEPVSMRGLGRVPRKIREILAQAMSKEREDRYLSADHWADDLEPLIEAPRRREKSVLSSVSLRLIIGAFCVMATFSAMTYLVVAEAMKHRERVGPPKNGNGTTGSTGTAQREELDVLFDRVRNDLNEGHVSRALSALTSRTTDTGDGVADMSKRLRMFLTHPKPLNDFAEVSPEETDRLIRFAWKADPKKVAALGQQFADGGIPNATSESEDVVRSAVAQLETARLLGHENSRLYFAMAQGYWRLKEFPVAIDRADQYFFSDGTDKAGHLLRARIQYEYGLVLKRRGRLTDAQLALDRVLPDINEAVKSDSKPLEPEQRQEAFHMLWRTYYHLDRFVDAMNFVGKMGGARAPFTPGFPEWATKTAFEIAVAGIPEPLARAPVYRWTFDRFRVDGTGPIEGSGVFLLPRQHKYPVDETQSSALIFGRSGGWLELKFRKPSTGAAVLLRIHGEQPKASPNRPISPWTLTVGGQALFSERKLMDPGRRWVEFDVTRWVTDTETIPLRITMSKSGKTVLLVYEIEIVGK